MTIKGNSYKLELIKNNIYISKNIEYLRKKNNLTQRNLGQKLGYEYTTIGNWENGIRFPDIIDLFRLSVIFKVPTDDLLKVDLKLKNKTERNKEQINEK